jgi:hypothetical protein
MDISDDLLALSWPESFVVVYRDGTSERLLRGSGVTVEITRAQSKIPTLLPNGTAKLPEITTAARIDSVTRRNEF